MRVIAALITLPVATVNIVAGMKVQPPWSDLHFAIALILVVQLVLYLASYRRHVSLEEIKRSHERSRHGN